MIGSAVDAWTSATSCGELASEVIIHDAQSGQMLTASFMDYQMPRADELPDFRLATREVPTKVNPIGAKGVGEAGTVGAMAAAMNAINDALRPLDALDLLAGVTLPVGGGSLLADYIHHDDRNSLSAPGGGDRAPRLRQFRPILLSRQSCLHRKRDL